MHQPKRGDALEAWIKRQRDCYPEGTDAWHTLDDLLDDYRILSDTGEQLPDPGEPPPDFTGYPGGGEY